MKALLSTNHTPALQRAKLAVFALLAALVAAALGADAASAQSVIHDTGINIRDALLSLGFILGGIGFAIGVLLKAVAGSNENMHHASHLAMKGGGAAVILAAIAIPALRFVEGLGAGGGGGGGGG